MAGAQLTGIGIVLVAVTVFATGIRPLFVLAGGVAALGALAVWQLRSVGRIGHPPRVVLRRRYWLYYALTFLDGGRRHIFMTFAIFLLVDNYGVSVRTITILALINSAVSIGGAYVVGRLIDRVGERPILVIAFGALAFIFLGYAVIPWLGVLFVLYILDHLFFSAEVGITTYLRRILVKPDEPAPQPGGRPDDESRGGGGAAGDRGDSVGSLWSPGAVYWRRRTGRDGPDSQHPGAPWLGRAVCRQGCGRAGS